MHVGLCLSAMDHRRYSRSQVREKVGELSKKYGLDHVELVLEGVGRRFAPYPWEWSPGELREVKDFLRPFTVSGAHLPFFGLNVISVNERVREEAMDQMRRAIEVAKALGVDYAVVHATGTTEGLLTSKEFDRHFKAFNRMLEWCHGSTMILSIENAQNLHDLNECATMVRRLKKEKGLPVAMTFDTGHAHHSKDGKPAPYRSFGTLADALEQCLDVVNNIHLHNNDGSSDQHRGLLQGTGELKACLERLRQRGFQGTISLEVRPLEEELEREIETLLHWLE